MKCSGIELTTPILNVARSLRSMGGVIVVALFFMMTILLLWRSGVRSLRDAEEHPYYLSAMAVALVAGIYLARLNFADAQLRIPVRGRNEELAEILKGQLVAWRLQLVETKPGYARFEYQHRPIDRLLMIGQWTVEIFFFDDMDHMRIVWPRVMLTVLRRRVLANSVMDRPARPIDEDN